MRVPGYDCRFRRAVTDRAFCVSPGQEVVLTPTSGPSATEPASSVTLSRQAALYGLVLMTLLNFVNYIDRYILAAVLPRVKTDLDLSDFQLGLLGGAFMFAYLLTSPVFGQLGDRLSRTRLMAVGVGLWSLATAAAGLARNFVQMFSARATVGVGEASYATISPALISDYFPRRLRGRVFAVFYLAIPVGSAVGYLLGGFLEQRFGWRAAFLAVGLPGLLLASLTLTAPDPPRGIQDAGSDPAPIGSLRETLAALLRNRLYVLTVLGYAAYTFAVGGLSFIVPMYLNRERGLPLASADLMLGLITVVTGVVGTFAGGYLGDALAQRVRQAYLYVSGFSMLLAVPFAWVAFRAESPEVYGAALFAGELLAFLSTGPINVVIVNSVPVGVRATAVAVSIFTIHLLGDATSPAIIGALSDAVGLARAVLLVPVAVAVSGIIWTATAWFHSHD
jgi:MFS family permease